MCALFRSICVAQREEDSLLVRVADQFRTDALDVVLQIPPGDPAKRHHAFFSVFAEDAEKAVVIVHVVKRKPDQLVFPNSAAVEDFQDSLVSIAEDAIGVRGMEDLSCLRGRRMPRGRVLGCLAYSARLALDQSQLQELRDKHGTELETWWQETFGHAFDCLTQSEARYLNRSPDADTIRIELLRQSKLEIAEAYRAKKAAASR